MPLVLKIVSRHRQSLGERGAMEFGQNGGTIGRSLENDWALPDGQRFLSSRHASIDFRSGSFYIVDTSTNGVYVNDSDQPVGRGNPQRLFTGDRLRIGEYEMSVEITGDDDTHGTLIEEGHVDPVSKAQRVSPPDPTRGDLVSPHEITAVGIEMLISDDAETGAFQRITNANAASLRLEDDFARTNPQSKAAPKPKESERSPEPPAFELDLDALDLDEPPTAPVKRPEPPAFELDLNALDLDEPPTAPVKRPEPPPVSASARIAPPAPKPGPAAAPAPKPSPVASAPSLDAFFRAAGLQPQRLDDKQTERVLHCLGQIMRELVLGVSENLHVRTEQKNVLGVSTTTSELDNNPLKFSATV